MEILTAGSINALDLLNLSKELAQINLGYLGIAVTILVILGGVFVYFNINPIKDALNRQEDKIDALKKEADLLLKSSVDKVETSLKEFKVEQKQGIDKLFGQNNQKMLSDIDSRIAEAEKDFFEKINNVAEDKDKKIKSLISSETENKISKLEKTINTDIEKTRTSFNGALSPLKEKLKTLEKSILDLKRVLVDFEIENHLKKDQIGAMIKMIEKLKMDKDRGWGENETLIEIKKYITEHGMPHFYLSNLQDAINELPSKFDTFKNEILKLAQEKVYKVGGGNA